MFCPSARHAANPEKLALGPPRLGLDGHEISMNMAAAQAKSPCPGCGGLFPDTDAPGSAHAYLGASHGCWAVYCDILAKEYGEYKYPEVHRLTVDSYAAQHPGTPSRQSIQSVAGHLISLYLVLERGMNAKRATAAIRKAIEQSHHFMWLPPPPSLGALTVLDVVGAKNIDEHTSRVQQWARSVWETWTPHHQTIQKWAER